MFVSHFMRSRCALYCAGARYGGADLRRCKQVALLARKRILNATSTPLGH